MDIFENCRSINDLITAGVESEARDELIKLLAFHESENIPYTPLVNHLIRNTGLYPYLDKKSALWEDQFVFDLFKVDVGGKEATLHREQSSLLKKLLEGENIAVSAPTSFGKSFIIDAYLSIKKPNNLVIIVPTIALTDETRRRIYKKFAGEYKIITTTEVELADKNIFIFPQERAFSYVNKIPSIDLFVIDEFYKASSKFDKTRSPALLKAIIKLGKIAKQRYYLAPNITTLEESVFTKGMEFIDKLDFSTVCLNQFKLYNEIGRDEKIKGDYLLDILDKTKTKSLIYAASYPQIAKVANLLNESLGQVDKPLLIAFSEWLTVNYDTNWKLTNLIKRGIGIHNGQLHRSLSQIQVKLFEEDKGLDTIISTSSIIEGVNTSAENVIIWRNRMSGSNAILDAFTYKNIIGRGGRMFKYFIGNIYLLEAPPVEDVTQLDLPFPDEILGDLDEEEYKDSLTEDQIGKIISFKEAMYGIVGKDAYDSMAKENKLQTSNSDFLLEVARGMKQNPREWNGLAYLNSDNTERWTWILKKITYLTPGEWGDGPYGVQHDKFVEFVKHLADNWTKSIPDLLYELDSEDIDIEQFFKLERAAAYKLSALVKDVNTLQKEIINNGVDVSSFVSRVSHAFLPSVVYQLEEYGLPRMISKKLHNYEVIDFSNSELSIHSVIQLFHQIGKVTILGLECFDTFDRYIIDYFYDGITVERNE